MMKMKARRGSSFRGFTHRRRGRAQRKQRGVALMTVIMAISFAVLLASQFATNTNIDMMSAANYRDRMRAHFLARSAQNLSELVIRAQQRIDNIEQLRGTQITDFADQILLALCGTPEEVQAAVGFDSSTAQGLGAIIGTCGVNGQITTDDDKINLNCANGNAATAASIKSALDGLLFSPAYDPLFEDEDAEGWRRDRAMQASALLDYIDNNAMRGAERGTQEDYGYENLKDPYRPKNTYVDTVGELRQIRGVDDRFWQLFGGAFTVYGGCKVNLTAVTNSQIIAGILMLAAKNPSDPLLANPSKLFLLASMIAKAKMYGMQFSSVDDFIEFAKDPTAMLGSVASQTGTMQGTIASAALQQGIPGLSPGERIGIELDKQKVSQLATAGPRRTYRVEAWGEIMRKQVNQDGTPVFPPIRATVTGVWDTKVVPQNVRRPPVPKGAWVFMKED